MDIVLAENGEHEALVIHDLGHPGNLGPPLDLINIRCPNPEGITDSTGIPLDSDRPDDSNIDFKYKACPYAASPSRYPEGEPHETPMSGLEQQRLVESYPRIRRELLAIRGLYFQLRGYSPDTQLTTGDGINILNVMQYLPHYLVNRAYNPIPPREALPPHLIVGSNCASGGTGAIGAFAYGNLGLFLPGGKTLMDAAEREGSMVGKKTVCAASPNMIVSFLDTLRNGNPKLKISDYDAEFDGLLSTDEFNNALVFGINMEVLVTLSLNLGEADARCLQKLEQYDPNTHPSSYISNQTAPFKALLEVYDAQFQAIAAQLNLALGRELQVDRSKRFIYDKDGLGIRSLKVARQKLILGL